MTELNTDAGAAGSEQAPVAVITAEGESALSVTEGARALAQARKPRERHPSQAGSEQRAAPNAPASELTALARQEAGQGAGDAASRETEIRGETENADPGGELPPIEPPKEDKELFTSLPRETQERIAERERSRESDFLRRQNEAADKLKGLTAKEQAVDQARQQYEAALPQLLVMLQAQQAGEFADVRTLADVERMTREDWPRYALWDVQQKKIAEVARQLSEVQQRQALEKQQQFSAFAKREDNLFNEKVPDMADDKKAAELQTRCLATLTGMGFAEAELAQ